METTPETGTPNAAGTLQETAFMVSNAAVKQLLQVLADEPAGSHLRIAVDGGGCSGFQYQFILEATPTTEDDLVIRHGDAVVVLDSLALDMLKGGMLDYVQTLGSAAFTIKNPNATATCGCGNSFSVM